MSQLSERQNQYRPKLKAGILLGVFTLSMSMMHMASAVDFKAIATTFVNNLGIGTLLGQTTDAQTNAVIVTTNQTALSAALLSSAIQKNSEMQAAVEQGIKVGEKIVEIQKDREIGRGLPASIGCDAIADKQLANTRKVITDEVIVSQTSAVAASHFINATQKRAVRTQSHLEDFCDVSESAQAICIPKPNGMGGIDTNYGAWSSTLALSKEKQQAAQNYIFNTIDPATTYDSHCESSLCTELAATERSYNALSSMVHSAFISQINDRVVLDVTPDVKSVITETIKADNPAATGPTVKGDGAPLPQPSSSASATASSASSTAGNKTTTVPKAAR